MRLVPEPTTVQRCGSHREVLSGGEGQRTSSGQYHADEHASTLHGEIARPVHRPAGLGLTRERGWVKSPLTMTHTCARGQTSCSLAGPDAT